MADIRALFLAHKCAWCSRWRAPYDRFIAWLGADVTHGICSGCVKRFEAQ